MWLRKRYLNIHPGPPFPQESVQRCLLHRGQGCANLEPDNPALWRAVPCTAGTVKPLGWLELANQNTKVSVKCEFHINSKSFFFFFKYRYAPCNIHSLPDLQPLEATCQTYPGPRFRKLQISPDIAKCSPWREGGEDLPAPQSHWFKITQQKASHRNLFIFAFRGHLNPSGKASVKEFSHRRNSSAPLT